MAERALDAGRPTDTSPPIGQGQMTDYREPDDGLPRNDGLRPDYNAYRFAGLRRVSRFVHVGRKLARFLFAGFYARFIWE